MPVQDLDQQQLALFSGDFATRGHSDAHFTRHRVDPRITVKANSIQALSEFVQRTSLATVLPDAITHDDPYLTPIPLAPSLPTRTVTLLTREGSYRSAAARAFTHLIHDHVTARACAPA